MVNVTVLLTSEPLSLDAAFRAVLDPACGGTALFVGTTRSPNQGHQVDELKATVPIWKKERWAGGGTWVGVAPAGEEAGRA